MINMFPVGFIFETEEGELVLTDRNSVYLPDSAIKKIKKFKISDEDYKLNCEDKARELDRMYKSIKNKKTDKEGFIYAVRIGTKIKLGRTLDPQRRFMAYKNVSDRFSILSIAKVSNYKSSELEMLKKFGWQNGENEYFEHSDELEKNVIRHILELRVMA